jgi:hypothetical protein
VSLPKYVYVVENSIPIRPGGSDCIIILSSKYDYEIGGNQKLSFHNQILAFPTHSSLATQ